MAKILFLLSLHEFCYTVYLGYNILIYRVTALENTEVLNVVWLLTPILRAGNEKPGYMQFSSVYVLYGTVNGDVITEVDCIDVAHHKIKCHIICDEAGLINAMWL